MWVEPYLISFLRCWLNIVEQVGRVRLIPYSKWRQINETQSLPPSPRRRDACIGSESVLLVRSCGKAIGAGSFGHQQIVSINNNRYEKTPADAREGVLR